MCNKKQDLLSLCEYLGSPTVVSGDARVALLFSFLCCVVNFNLFVYLRPGICIPNVASVPGLSIRVSLTFQN